VGRCEQKAQGRAVSSESDENKERESDRARSTWYLKNTQNSESNRQEYNSSKLSRLISQFFFFHFSFSIAPTDTVRLWGVSECAMWPGLPVSFGVVKVDFTIVIVLSSLPLSSPLCHRSLSDSDLRWGWVRRHRQPPQSHLSPSCVTIVSGRVDGASRSGRRRTVLSRYPTDRLQAKSDAGRQAAKWGRSRTLALSIRLLPDPKSEWPTFRLLPRSTRRSNANARQSGVNYNGGHSAEAKLTRTEERETRKENEKKSEDRKYRTCTRIPSQ